jgi:hypothetical protein
VGIFWYDPVNEDIQLILVIFVHPLHISVTVDQVEDIFALSQILISEYTENGRTINKNHIIFERILMFPFPSYEG